MNVIGVPSTNKRYEGHGLYSTLKYLVQRNLLTVGHLRRNEDRLVGKEESLVFKEVD